jgi:hypothetical protein
VFGEASGLVTNISKCSFTPITCGDQQVQIIQQFLPCSLVQFPCKYLGLPLGIKKLPRTVFYQLIVGIADWLPGWKASHSPGRKVRFGQGCPVFYPNLSSDCAAVS